MHLRPPVLVDDILPSRPDCPEHGRWPDFEPAPRPEDVTAAALLAAGDDGLDLGMDVVAGLLCAPCDRREGIGPVPLARFETDALACPTCGGNRVPETLSSLRSGDPLEDLPLASFGLQSGDVVRITGCSPRALELGAY